MLGGLCSPSAAVRCWCSLSLSSCCNQTAGTRSADVFPISEAASASLALPQAQTAMAAAALYQVPRAPGRGAACMAVASELAAVLECRHCYSILSTVSSGAVAPQVKACTSPADRRGEGGLQRGRRALLCGCLSPRTPCAVRQRRVRGLLGAGLAYEKAAVQYRTLATQRSDRMARAAGLTEVRTKPHEGPSIQRKRCFGAAVNRERTVPPHSPQHRSGHHRCFLTGGPTMLTSV